MLRLDTGCLCCGPQRGPAVFKHSQVRTAAVERIVARTESRNRVQLPVALASRALHCAKSAASVKIKSAKESRACRCHVAAKPQMLDLSTMSPPRWDKITTRCVELSTIAFIFLLMPQVVKNYISMANNNNEALAVLSWVVRTC